MENLFQKIENEDEVRQMLMFNKNNIKEEQKILPFKLMMNSLEKVNS